MDLIRVSSRLFSKRKAQEEEEKAPEEIHDSPSSAAIRQRRYRKRLKQRPDYQKLADQHANRCKQYRQSLSEEKKKEAREKARIRQQKLREKKRLKGADLSPRKKPATKSALENKRAKDRIRQQKYRAGLSTQKKDAIRLKRKQKRYFSSFQGCEMDIIPVSSSLFSKQRALEEEEKVPENIPDPLPICSSSAAIRQRRYRERLKQRPDYQKLAVQHADRCKQYRQSLSEEKKQKERENARIRQQKLREKMRLQGVDLSLRKKPVTKTALENKRAKDRIRQQKYRAGLSTQKKAAIRLRRKQKRDEAKARKMEEENMAVSKRTLKPEVDMEKYIKFAHKQFLEETLYIHLSKNEKMIETKEREG